MGIALITNAPSLRSSLSFSFSSLFLFASISFNFICSILNSIFGRGIATGESAFRLQGFSREPSFYALALYNVIVLFILKIGTTGDIVKYIYWILASILIGVISGAFSFLWVFVCCISFNSNKKTAHMFVTNTFISQLWSLDIYRIERVSCCFFYGDHSWKYYRLQ